MQLDPSSHKNVQLDPFLVPLETDLVPLGPVFIA